MIVFIAGPYRAASAWAIEMHVRSAEHLALDVWRSGHVAICPHAMTRYYQGALPDDVWLPGIRQILGRCDCVLLASGWEGSAGTLMEIDVAKEHGLPVFKSLSDLLVAADPF